MDKRLERILPRVQKPARYVGGEYNAVKKDPAQVDTRIAFCFPDTYEIGMSNLGMRILYGVMNNMEGVWCQRVFAPWGDMEEEMRRAAQDLIHAVCNAGVHLCMGQTRTAEQLKDAGFEAVINAVGAHSAAPRIPGIDSVNVADAWKVLAGEQQVYGTVAVIGGGMVGCETAEYLAARGCKVSVIEMMDKIAAGESTTILPTLLENYKTYGVEQYPSHKVKEFRMDAVVCENKDGAEVTIPCDYIVLAMGARSNEFDAAALEAASIPVYSIGDAAGKAADISNAIRTGYDTACQL